VVKDFKIDWADAFGKRAATLADPVRTTTLFQAASISKPVTALAVMKLAQAGAVDLDADVNKTLKSWQVPDSPLLKDHPITLRKLLSHSAGLSVHGFAGYAPSEKQPSLIEILDGTKPANNLPIRPEIKPGYLMRYSGGGYCVMQQLLVDITGKSFPRFMKEEVLDPLEMNDSTYEQPLASHLVDQAAFGHRAHGVLVEGNYHVYPEMAPAGLWTTPSDLARVVIDLSKSLARGDGRLLSTATAKEMTTVQKGNFGLGVVMQGDGANRSFAHGGSNEGFRCQLIGYPADGHGLIVMTNSDTGDIVIGPIIQAIKKAYGWE
jgi:CubicO group peptidase (beta-lactamase class C family)